MWRRAAATAARVGAGSGGRHARHLEDPARRSKLLVARVLVRQEDNFFDARLNNQLRALVTREQCHINGAVLHICRVLVQYCIQFSMAHCNS